MTLNRLLLLSAALLQLPVATPAQGLADILTNVAPKATAVMPRRPSIIFIQCHGLGAGELSCYGQTNYQTPNLDRLAATGVKFTGYDLASAAKPDSTAALLAGKSEPTALEGFNLVERLQLVGYRTCLLGEWSLDRQPWTHGFQEFAGFFDDAEARNYYADSFWRYSPNFFYSQALGKWTEWTPADGPNTGGKESIYQNMGGKKSRYLPDELFTWAAHFVRGNQPDKFNHFRPFFLLVNLPAPRSVTPGKDDYPVPTDAPYTGENWPQAAKNRAALVGRIDSGVGRLLEQLSKAGLTNQLALFFSGLTAPEKFADTNLTAFFHPAGAPRVPMIMHWPGQHLTKHTSAVAWTPADFAPTVLDLALIRPAANFTGISILPALRAPATNPPAPAHP